MTTRSIRFPAANVPDRAILAAVAVLLVASAALLSVFALPVAALKIAASLCLKARQPDEMPGW